MSGCHEEISSDTRCPFSKSHHDILLNTLARAICICRAGGSAARAPEHNISGIVGKRAWKLSRFGGSMPRTCLS